jgi:hypothetical protein
MNNLQTLQQEEKANDYIAWVDAMHHTADAVIDLLKKWRAGLVQLEPFSKPVFMDEATLKEKEVLLEVIFCVHFYVSQ